MSRKEPTLDELLGANEADLEQTFAPNPPRPQRDRWTDPNETFDEWFDRIVNELDHSVGRYFPLPPEARKGRKKGGAK